MPSRPVVEPSSTARLPGPEAAPSTSRSTGRAPRHSTLTSGLLGVAGVEGELAAHRRHAHRVAVAGDAAHHPLDQPALPGVVEGPEEQGVHHGQGTGPHGEDVAQDAPHPGRRPLVGLDGRGVVVALDADGHGDAVAGVDHPGVLARPDQDPVALGGQAAQVEPRRLVGAVLAPHHGVEGQLEVVGRPPEDRLDLVELVVGQPEGPVERLGGGSGVGHGAHVATPDHQARTTWGGGGRRAAGNMAGDRSVGTTSVLHLAWVESGRGPGAPSQRTAQGL